MYSTYNISALAEIPPLVKAFAALNGWTTSGVCVVTRPGGGKSFSMYAEPDMAFDSGRAKALAIVEVGSNPLRGVRTHLPIWGGGPTLAEPNILFPTKLYLFGGEEEGQAYISGVIECGFNAYRHFYIGNMVKLGDYTGGEVISMNCGAYAWQGTYAEINYGTSGQVRYLFSAHQNRAIDDTQFGGTRFSGGVNVVHADNPNSWRSFYAFMNGGQPYYDYQVFGGSRDGPNDGFAAKARSNYAGAQILVPINLFCPDSTQAHYDVRFRPIGYPAGVRIISMENLAQGQELEVGNKHWRAFPEFSKWPERLITNEGSGWVRRESSYRAGIAHLTD